MQKHHARQIGRLTLIAAALVVMLGILAGSWACSKGDYPEKVESIRLLAAIDN